MLRLIDPDNKRIPSAFLDGAARIPSNPAVTTALASILNGGPCAKQLMGGWFAAEGGFPAYARRGRQRGHVTVRIGPPPGEEESPPDPADQWKAVEGMSALTLDTALIVLAQLCDPRFGDKTFHPDRQPVGISAESVIAYKGYRRWGREREAFRSRIAEEISRLSRLRIDVNEFPGWDPEVGRWNPRGVSISGDRLFEVVTIGIRKAWDPALSQVWPIRLGGWTRWWMNPQGKVWSTKLPAVLIELDHRPNRAAQVLAKKIGLNSILLLATARGRPSIVRRIDRLLEDVGNLPCFECRHDHWAGRIRDRFEESMMLLVEAGLISGVNWPENALPGDFNRQKGWVDHWLAEKIEIVRVDTHTPAARGRGISTGQVDLVDTAGTGRQLPLGTGDVAQSLRSEPLRALAGGGKR